MDTSKLKRFATEARNKIRRGVANKLLTLGFNGKGEAAEFPVQLQGATLFRGEQLEAGFYDKWIALHEAITKQGVKDVYEEVAYTWFNRFMAIRILQMNGFIDRALLFDDPTIRVPHIVSEARQGRYPELTTDERLRLQAIIADPTKTYEQFALLITALCHTTPVLNKCFGAINDYTELLFPTDILDEGGFVDMINHTDFISEDDYKTTELLGWLYQFYIAEHKDEVFASFKKGGKAEADDIPAATQIFTPNWIVKYMVENTVGRIYLDNNPDSSLAQKMPYLVERAEGGDEGDVFKYSLLEDLKVLDPACGSGHILLEAFDLLYDLYIDEFYSRDEAITAIFRCNLLGIDIDTRARQLATFALLLKACQRDDSFLDGHCMPRVLDMAYLIPSRYDTLRDMLPHFFQSGTQQTIDEVIEAYKLMEQADNLGSIMKFDISASTREHIAESMQHWENECKDDFDGLFHGMRMILALSDKYAAVVANPPYMGGGNMNKVLSEYVKKNYPDSKSDFFSVFMDVAADRLAANGKYGMINMQSWMFLSSFEKLRRKVLEKSQIDSMLHLGSRTFDELSGEVVQNTAFIIANHAATHGGTYFRLVDGKDCSDKERIFREANLITNHSNLIHKNVSQKNFEKIPGCPIGYWVSEKFIYVFRFSPISTIARPIQGSSTGDNDRFLRLWYEVSDVEIDYAHDNSCPFVAKWYPFNKGGGFRKWYGNNEFVVNWYNNGEAIRNYKGSAIRNSNSNFKEGLTWSGISSTVLGIRYCPNGYIFSVSGKGIVDFKVSKEHILGFCCSKVSNRILQLTTPTMSFEVGYIASLPINETMFKCERIRSFVIQNISISRQDWDTHETSWDFKENELLTLSKEPESEINSSDSQKKEPGQKIDDLLASYKAKWEGLFMQLHANEEELNRQFIEIYGLQDELTPDVPLEEVTILQQGELTIEKEAYLADNDGAIFTDSDGSKLVTTLDEPEMEWHDDVIIKQLISYAVGCMMGRYSLDKPGLILANQGDGVAEYNKLVPNSRFEVDDDGIMPLMPEAECFPDNAARRMSDFLKIAFGENTLVENLNCIEAKLGKRLEDYLAKDFWKDHKKMYQNRPIYWLFQSKKGAFRVLVYMHRMDPYIVGKIRNKYLLPYIEWIKGKIETMMARQAELTGAERKKLQNYGKQLDECREYDIRLHEVANRQIAIDLDDGVLVNSAKYGDVLAKLK